MCMFSGAVTGVSGTNIFARRVGAGRQALVYSMTLATDKPVAMCLPLPIVPGSAVQFIDLSGYRMFFDDCEAAFPAWSTNDDRMMAAAELASPQTLAVHAVGDFVASFVPTVADFDRLDARFRLPAGVLAAHAEYAEWGFAVFQLASTKTKRRWFWQRVGPDAFSTFHPMALTFQTRHERALFFPTLHLHDGATVPREADYDHTLYCQPGDAVVERTFGWRRSPERLGASVEVAHAAGLVDGDARAYRRLLRGRSTNIDHLIAPPACRLESLTAHRELFAFELAATAAYYSELGTAQSRAWHTTATTRLDDLHDALVAGLTAVCADRREAWKLVPLPTDAVPVESQLVVTERGLVRRPTENGTYVMMIGTSTDRVERQNVTFAFSAVPDRKTIGAIELAIFDILERAVA